MSGRGCDGWVRSLRGETAVITGRVEIKGKHLTQPACNNAVDAKGGTARDYMSGVVTLLVQGDLSSKRVKDAKRGYSVKLIDVQERRERHEPHIHVVDAEGFGHLLRGEPARCRRLIGSGRNTRLATEPGDGIFGGPLKPRKTPKHAKVDLKVDLSGLDRGTAAHEATIEALIKHLASKGTQALGPIRGAPRFDAGWERGKTAFIAEVKSLSDTNEDQQIRLGIGQILDYAWQMPPGRKVTPVLVLEKRPPSERWEHVAKRAGILLTYGPRFEGI